MVTLEDLMRAGRRLEVGCFACHYHGYVDPAAIALAPDTPTPFAGDRMGCPRCGARNREKGYPLWSRPDARQPGWGG